MRSITQRDAPLIPDHLAQPIVHDALIRPRRRYFPLAERDADKAEHQERGEPERYAAEHIHRGDGVADRPRFGGVAEPGNVRNHPGNRGAERGANRAYRGQGGGGAAMFEGGHAIHRSGDDVHIVYADADPHHESAQRHQREPWQQSHRRQTGESHRRDETYRAARAAMALIREAVEDCAPPGSVPRGEYFGPEFTVEAEALVRGIYAIVGWSLRLQAQSPDFKLRRASQRLWGELPPVLTRYAAATRPSGCCGKSSMISNHGAL